MENAALRVLIRQKLADGRLPHDNIQRLWGRPANEDICKACEEVLPKGQLVMEWINASRGAVQFHVACFAVWDALRSPRGTGRAVIGRAEVARSNGDVTTSAPSF